MQLPLNKKWNICWTEVKRNWIDKEGELALSSEESGTQPQLHIGNSAKNKMNASLQHELTGGVLGANVNKRQRTEPIQVNQV